MAVGLSSDSIQDDYLESPCRIYAVYCWRSVGPLIEVVGEFRTI